MKGVRHYPGFYIVIPSHIYTYWYEILHGVCTCVRVCRCVWGSPVGQVVVLFLVVLIWEVGDMRVKTVMPCYLGFFDKTVGLSQQHQCLPRTCSCGFRKTPIISADNNTSLVFPFRLQDQTVSFLLFAGERFECSNRYLGRKVSFKFPSTLDLM